MKALKKTEDGGLVTPHHHIVYVDTDSGVGYASFSEGHSHEVEYLPPMPEQADEQGQVVSPATPGSWILHPAPDGHTHNELLDYKIKKRESGEKDEEILRDVLILLRESQSLEGKSKEKAAESKRFIAGDQWESTLKSRLESENRAALTINFAAKYINELIGHEIQNRTDIRYLPLEDGDQRVADMLNVLSKHICNQCYYDREKSKVFRDVVVGGRGIFNIYVDTGRDIRGEIKIERFPDDQFFAGPHEKEDLADGEYIQKSKMFSLAKVKQLWPDKAEDVDSKYSDMVELTQQGHLHVDRNDQYNTPSDIYPVMCGDVKLVDIAKKEIRVIETWRKRYVENLVAANPDHDCYINIYGWEKSDVDQVATLPGFTVIKRPGVKMRITKVAGGVVLDDDFEAELPADDFFVTPVYCNKDGSEFWGKVEDIKDAQRGVNKRHSQAIDIANRMAANGWFFDANTFPDNEAENFKTNAAKPGFVQEVNDTSRLPVKVEGAAFPSEIVKLMEVDSKHISDLMNISIQPRGANTSAQALLQEQKNKLTGNEYIFDAISFAQMRIGRLLVKLIQRYYAADRIFRILVNANARKPVTLAGQPMAEYSEDEILHLLETADLDQYDVEIAEAPNSPSARLTTYSILSDLMNKGAPVGWESVIKVADIPDQQKQEILQSIQAQQEAQGQAQSATQEMEIGKALVAQGIIPPKIAEQFGLSMPSQGAATDFQGTGSDGALAESI